MNNTTRKINKILKYIFYVILGALISFFVSIFINKNNEYKVVGSDLKNNKDFFTFLNSKAYASKFGGDYGDGPPGDDHNDDSDDSGGGGSSCGGSSTGWGGSSSDDDGGF